jgi:GTP pyrophosphokinase
MWKVILKAARFARARHAGQKRAHGTPYFGHPKAVARSLWDAGRRDEAVIAAAYLHDVVEDSGVALDTLMHTFGLPVAHLVGAVTKRKGEAHEAYYERVRAAGESAMALKYHDRMHNNSELDKLPPEKAYIREKAEKKTAAMLAVFLRK